MILQIPIDRFSELLSASEGTSVVTPKASKHMLSTRVGRPAEVTDNATVNAADVIIWMARGDSSRSLGAVAGTCSVDNTGGRFGD